MRFDVVTLFPEMVATVMTSGVIASGFKRELLTLGLWNPRDYTSDKHRSVDDRSYGGGPGMVMRPEPLVRAIDDARCAAPGPVQAIYLSPEGRRLDHAGVMALAARDRLLLVAGRYEGVDQRVIDSAIDEVWSIGDYVLAGGELAAMVMIEAVARHVDGVLGNAVSAEQDSFADGLLDHAHYTRPPVYRGMKVPETLLSGDHEAVRRWRRADALARTERYRPDLLRPSATAGAATRCTRSVGSPKRTDEN